MSFEKGQWYRTVLGRRAEILAVDSVRVGREEIEVIAYRCEGKEAICMRSVELAEGWVLDRPLAVGDEIRRRKVVAGVRVGHSERRVVTYVSDWNVCYGTFSFDGRRLSEHCRRRAEFERVPE